MNRRTFLTQATGSAALLTPVANTAAQPSVPVPAAVPPALPTPVTDLVLTPPVAMAPRPDGVEIVWGVSRHARGWVEVKNGENVQKFGGNDFGFSSQGDRVLRVRLEGLAPGKTYCWRAITEAMGEPAARHETEWREVRTLDPQAESTRFTVWNDTHLNNETILKLHGTTGPSDFLVWNGDICNDWTKDELLIPALLHPAGTDFTAKAPLCFVWGNHDLRGAHGYKLSNYVATPSGKSWYAFRSGPVAVVVLNTGEDKADDHPSFKGRVACEPIRAEQADWLKAEVLTNPMLRDASYRIVICHIPLRWTKEAGAETREYDNFSGRSRKLWHEALTAWKAQIVLSGHVHQVAWIPATPAFSYAQITGGGPKPDRATRLEVNANPTRLQIKVVSLADNSALVEQEFSPVA